MKLHSAQEAINLAIEGGWRYENNDGHIATVLLDPLFWEALAKARGWIDENYPNGEMRCDIKVNGEQRCEERYCSYAGFRDPKEIAHSWFETRLSNGDETKFWEQML